MALVGMPPNGGLTFLRILDKAGLHEREETNSDIKHPLLHLAAKPPKLHRFSNHCQNLALLLPCKVGTLIRLTLNRGLPVST
jgi:hypothetical protein